MLACIFVFFLIHRFSVGWRVNVLLPVSDTTIPQAQSVVCRNIVGGAPFGVDSVFDALRTRVYVVSTWKNRNVGASDSLYHAWYRGGDLVSKELCPLAQGRCASSISPEQLRPGDWSVDFVHGRRLLSTRQFRVQSDALY